jgi:hypothetical protein
MVESKSANKKSRIGEFKLSFKLSFKKRGCTGTELALLTRSVQLWQKLLELVPAAARQMHAQLFYVYPQEHQLF